MNRVSPVALFGFGLALLAGELLVAGTAKAQPPMAPEAGSQSRRIPPNRILNLTVNGNLRRQMSRLQPIDSVVNDNDVVAEVTAVAGDPTTVNIKGKAVGVATITLTGTDRSVEEYQLVVSVIDIEYLRTVLRQTFPTANLQLSPVKDGILMTGTVLRAEDIQPILQAAATLVTLPGEAAANASGRIINGLRVEGVMQVQLDVVIARVSRTKMRELGFNFLNRGSHHVFGGAISSVTPAGAGALGTPPTAPGSGPTNVFLGLFNNEQEFFGFLDALKTEGVAKELAEPRVTTVSGKSASFLSGGQQAVPEFTGGGAGGAVGSIRFEPFGVRVSVLPIVLGNGQINLEIEADVSQIAPPGDSSSGPVPGTNLVENGRITQSVHTTAVMQDGQTFALGGIIEKTLGNTMVALPVLGEIPFVGVAFSRKVSSEQENEVVIVVTPHLVDPMSCLQAPKIFPGQETRNVDDYELFLEGILEAPRGQREVCPGNRYTPAWKNGPSAGQFPCGGNGQACSGLIAEAGMSDLGTSIVGAEYHAPAAAPVMSPSVAPAPMPTTTAIPAPMPTQAPVMAPAPPVAPAPIAPAPAPAPSLPRPVTQGVSNRSPDLAPSAEWNGVWTTAGQASRGQKPQPASTSMKPLTLPAPSGPSGFEEP